MYYFYLNVEYYTLNFNLDYNMRSEVERNLALRLKNEGSSYNEISKVLGISKDSVRNLCKYKYKARPKKRGPKFKLDSRSKLSIKREISNLNNLGQKVNCSKLVRNCNLKVSQWTCHRYLMKEEYKYRNSSMQICLSRKHKDERIKRITEWITINHNWEKTIFSDEKKFSLDGPDVWRTYVHKSDKFIRQQRQCGGGGVMIWLMVMPNSLLCHRVIKGSFKSLDYIGLLKSTVLPIARLNFGNEFVFQEDNCTVHKAKIVKDFMKTEKINVLNWPAKSPDLNITEDIWKVLSDIIYDGPQFHSTKELIKSINTAIFEINTSKRHLISNLYGCIRSRLCKVLNGHGNLYNK